jgi:hypothetical protein
MGKPINPKEVDLIEKEKILQLSAKKCKGKFQTNLPKATLGGSSC